MKLDTENLVKAITKALTEKFGKNPSAPSLITSYIGDKVGWYVSVATYGQCYGKEKDVLVAHQGFDLYDLYTKIADWLLGLNKISDLDILKCLMQEDKKLQRNRNPFTSVTKNWSWDDKADF